MTSERDFDRIARAWLDLGPDEAPDRAIDSVLQAIETTPQVRRPIRWPFWRPTIMTRLPVLAALAGLIIIVIGALALSGGSTKPTQAPSPQQSPAATVAANPTAYPEPLPMPDAIVGGWVAPSRKTSIEDPALTTITFGSLDPDNGGAPGYSVDRAGYERQQLAAVMEAAPGTIELKADGAGGDLTKAGGCQALDVAHYGWSVSADGQWLTLTVVDEACPARGKILPGTWQRSLAHDSHGGSGIAANFQPFVQLTLPDGTWVGRGTAGMDEVVVDRLGGPTTFKIWKDLDGFNDPCDINAGRKVLPPGMDGFLGYLNGDPRFTVDSQKEYTIDGHRAVEVAFTIGKDIKAPCWDFDGNAADKTGVLTWATNASKGRSWNAPINSLGLLVVTEVGDATLVFEAASGPDSNPTVDRSTLDTVRLLDALPTAPAS